MKFKNKILLASASLLVLSGAAASTGVFAWYTANRAAEVKVTTMTATSTEGALTIADGGNKHGVTITAKGSSAPKTDPDLTINPETGAYLVDVTGNGDGTFNKPFYVKESNDAAGMVGHWDNEDAYRKNYSTNAFYYYSFDLKFTIGGGDGSYGLLLSKSCTLTDTDKTTAVADTVRLSAKAGNRKVYANINGDDTGYYSYSGTTWSEGEPLTKGETQGILTSNYFKPEADGTFKDGSTFNTKDDNYLGSITAGDEGGLTVTFYVWVEGHASENTDAKKDLAAAGDSSATFDLSLKFYTIKA